MRSKAEIFAGQLNFLLKKEGLSGRQLAVELGIPEQTVSRWRSGARMPYRRHILSLAQRFNVEEGVFYSEDFGLAYPMAPLAFDEEQSLVIRRSRCLDYLKRHLTALNDAESLDKAYGLLNAHFPLEEPQNMEE
ncbi:helix-turn-helix transcriptional regulator [Coraliomargarita sp. SDUM461004]|uniref:Helix-turn-helix transcriptional regulator n=1 Tax=Thalassobacterium sedimentorum TaxID=3041258 RepID=A0ABU1AKB5_9BACT|nr:helix-turn-helix transcriptional regulator [Coraliomargarita sp. SDUM461004]MDQ8195094.1 helix-turn-helix transcriptional regulator [Coraliomargarita sp. SDUM461004]